MNDPLMPTRLVAEGRPGFYLRVLAEGDVAAGDAIEVIGRNAASVTVSEIDALLYRPKPDADALERALKVQALSTGWRRSLEELVADPADAAGARGLAAPDLAPHARTGFRPAQIVDLSRLTRDVVAVSLAATDSGALDPAEPGQFVVVKTAGAIGLAPIVRSYSLTASTESGRCEIAVKCEPNGSMGGYLSGRARVGDKLEMSAPRGSFVLSDDTRPVVLMSAGIGITPVLAMLRSLAAARSSRRVWWLYGARSGVEHPFAADVRALLSDLANAQWHVRYSRPAANDRAGSDFDSVGRLEAGLIQQLGISAESAFYLCGPSLFLQELKAGLYACGIPMEQVHSEVFGARPSLNPGIVSAHRTTPHAPPGPAGAGPAVSFARSGIAATWDPRYASLLEFAEACDVPTRWSCRTGVCHTCESGLIAGEVRYGPAPLQPPAPGNVLPCCSVPASAIVLDL
jgi:ferredoxin-NADP reductase/ferredoxin